MTNHFQPQSQANQSFSTATTADGRAQLTDKAINWLRGRGIEPELSVKCGLKSNVQGIGGKEAIDFPYKKGGEVVNIKTRTIDDKQFMQQAGGEQCLYAPQGWGTGDLVITEGEMDCLSALQAGFSSVSVPIGAGASYDWLAIPKERDVIIAADGDAKGAELFATLCDLIGRPRCKYVNYPDGCKDLNDVLMKEGESGVNAVLRGAKWVSTGGFFSLDELPPMPAPKAFSLNLPLLDCNIREGEFSVITGFPCVGKTTILNMMAREVTRQGAKVCFASFEQSPAVQIPRLISVYAKGDKSKNQEARKEINQNIFVITPPELVGKSGGEQTDISWLLNQMAAAVRRKGCKWIIIDPWNEIEHFYPSGMSMTQYVGKAIMEIKRFAKEYNVHVTVVAHPSKPPYEMAHKKPSLHNIADSQHWYNKADLGLVFARHELESGGYINEIEVAKSRYEDEIGKLGRQFYEISFNSQSLIPASEGDIEQVAPKKKKFTK